MCTRSTPNPRPLNTPYIFPRSRSVKRFLFSLSPLTLGLLIAVQAASLDRNASGQTAPVQAQPEFQLKAETNLVIMKVVVRDASGKPISGLKKEDFQLLDRNKKQAISQFEEEKGSAPRSAATPAADASEQPAPSGRSSGRSAPIRYLALYFDNLNSSEADLIQARDAADRYLTNSLLPGDRIALFTSDALLSDFTADPARIHAALSKLHVSTQARQTFGQCPKLSEYQAQEILEAQDITHDSAWSLATAEVKSCGPPSDNPGGSLTRNQSIMIRMQAQRLVDDAGIRNRVNLSQLEKVAATVAEAPGERTLVLVSPGFLSLREQTQLDRIIDRALQAQLVIDSLDPKGLAVLMREADASSSTVATASERANAASHSLDAAQEFSASDVLAEIAEGTGGQFIHNQNDLRAGFDSLLARPTQYTLAFSPENSKRDGKYHQLKVSLTVKRKGSTIQARKGYFAPSASPASTPVLNASTTSAPASNPAPVSPSTNSESASSSSPDSGPAAASASGTPPIPKNDPTPANTSDRLMTGGLQPPVPAPAADGKLTFPAPDAPKSSPQKAKKQRETPATTAKTKRVAVSQLDQMLTASLELPDPALALQLGGLELTERLSTANLASWLARLPGKESQQALNALADQSAFLEPPPTEHPARAQLDSEQQAKLIGWANDYVQKTISRLPNFLAVRQSNFYEDVPPSHSSVTFVPRKPLHLIGTSSATAYYHGGSEVIQPTSKEKKASGTEGALDTAGQFGPTLAMVFTDAANGAMIWDHWDLYNRDVVAVFRYSVPRKKSHYSVWASVPWYRGSTVKERPGYHGEIAIDPSDGTVLRLTILAELDPSSPMAAADLMVEYGVVQIGGRSYTCPIRSVALVLAPVISETGSPARYLGFGGLHDSEQGAHDGDDRPLQTLINDVAFERYHLFGSESRMLTETSGSSDQKQPDQNQP